MAPEDQRDYVAGPGAPLEAGESGAFEGGVLRQRRTREERQRLRQRARRMMVVRTLLLMLVCLLVGICAGLLAYPHIPFPGTEASLPGRLTVTESELNTPLGSYSYQGDQTVVTVREAIEESMSLETARNADGTYNIPSVDSVLSIARNHFLLLEADSHGIAATDEDMLAYAREVWMTDDFSLIAASYGMSEEQVRDLMKRSATIKKLRDEVVTTEAIPEPTAPQTPEAGKEDEPEAQYAEYILGLVGDEWDANANSWARDDGPFHDQLKNFTISNDAATYSAAQAAYFVAQAQYAAVEQQISSEWTTYVNQILSDVTVQLGTLVA